MTKQPTPPELPPMPSPKAAPLPERPVPAPMPQAAFGGTKRLRQAVTAIAGGGFVLVAVVCGGELTLREGLRPTDLMATIEARTDLGIWNQKLGAKPGELFLTEDAYKARIAEAERGGQAKAELVFQEKLAVVQADKERVVGAYTTLYQRATIIAQAAIQLETLAQQFRQQLLQMTNGGRSVVIGMKDLFCGLGSPEACESAREDRRSMISEADELSRGDVGARVRELMAGVEDPASFVVADDRQRHGVPALPR